MKEIISSFRSSIGVFTVGLKRPTPKGVYDEVKQILLTEEEEKCFTICFNNGERLIVYPISPFDYGTEIIGTKIIEETKEDESPKS